MDQLYLVVAMISYARNAWTESYLVKAADLDSAVMQMQIVCPEATVLTVTEVDARVPYFLRASEL